MNETLLKAGEINYLVDNMISKICEIRDQYDAAQASDNSSQMISDMKKVNVPELRGMNNGLKQKVNEFLGVLV